MAGIAIRGKGAERLHSGIEGGTLGCWRVSMGGRSSLLRPGGTSVDEFTPDPPRQPPPSALKNAHDRLQRQARPDLLRRNPVLGIPTRLR